MIARVRLPLAGLVLSVLLPGCAPPEPAHLIVTGRVYTMDEARPVAEAVAVREGTIVAIGDRAAVDRFRGADTRVLDAGPGVVMPSFVDHHVHLLSMGLAILSAEGETPIFVDVSGAASADEVGGRVARAASGRPAGEWILGWGWNQSAWTDSAGPADRLAAAGSPDLPTHEALSRAAPDHPVYLTRSDAHAGWANAAALRAAGIDAGTPDPAGGRIVRDAGGRPTGVLLERANDLVVARLRAAGAGRLPDEVIVAAFRRAAAALAERGVTEVFDAGFLAPPAVVALNADFSRYLALLRRADAESPLPVRVHLMLPAPSGLADSVLAVPDSARRLSGRVDITHLKLFADGALGSRGAALSHAYADDPSTRGVPRMSAAEIEHVGRLAVGAGLDVAVHAIGDAATASVLDAFEALLAERPRLDPARLRIEHLSYARAADLERAARLGIVVSIQSNFNDFAGTDPTFGAIRVGEGNAARVYAWRTLDSLEARLVEGSDGYGLPGAPLVSFEAALTRVNAITGRYEGTAARFRALRHVLARTPTHGRASPSGRIARGLPADLVVLGADPLTAPEAELLEIEVIATVSGGRLTHAPPGGP